MTDPLAVCRSAGSPPGVSTRRRRPQRGTAHSYPTYFSFGAIALHLVFIVIPSVMGIYYALTNWSRFSSATDFVGLDNFRTVFRSHGAIFQAVKNTLIFTGATIVTKTVLGSCSPYLSPAGSVDSRRFIAQSSTSRRACHDRCRDRLQVDPESLRPAL